MFGRDKEKRKKTQLFFSDLRHQGTVELTSVRLLVAGQIPEYFSFPMLWWTGA